MKMVKLTEAQWNKVWPLIPEQLRQEIQEVNYAASIKGKPASGFIATVDGNKPCKVEVLSDNWAIGPRLVGDTFHRTEKALLHSPSGLAACYCKNRTQVITLWKKINNLQIEITTAEELAKSPDFAKFRTECRVFSI
jgi:hypothetical protein